MSEYIKREAAIDAFTYGMADMTERDGWEHSPIKYGYSRSMINYVLKSVHAADVKPVIHGKLIKPTPLSEAVCNVCGKSPKLAFGASPSYCPHCGAKLDK